MSKGLTPGAVLPDFNLPDENGAIRHQVYVGYWFWGRPSPFQLWEDLQDLLRRTKADFDPTTERARAAWTAASVPRPARG